MKYYVGGNGVLYFDLWDICNELDRNYFFTSEKYDHSLIDEFTVYELVAKSKNQNRLELLQKIKKLKLTKKKSQLQCK